MAAKTSHALLPLAIAASFAVACGPPAPLSAQEVLRDTTPPLPIRTASLAPGAEAAFGETTVLVESASSLNAPRDLAKDSVMDSLALVVAASSSVDTAAAEIASTAEDVKKGVRARAGHVQATVRFKGSVREQAESVRKGASDVAKVAAAVEGAASLALALGAFLGKTDEKKLVRIAAISRGIPHRATCTVNDEGSAEMPKSSVSCAITRADAPPTVVWHLDVGTQNPEAAMFGKMIPASRGWLQTEPKGAAGAPIWISRPDESVPFLRRGIGDYAAFALQQDRVAVARMRIADESSPSTVWLAPDGSADESAMHAASVSLAILSLMRWPALKPDPPEKKN